MEESGTKRSREESEESPEAKRLRADLFFDILDDDSDADERDPATQDLASVMKIFEEEIAHPPPPRPPVAPDAADPSLPAADFENPRQPELGYLLEASDDELGLPPTVPSSSDEGGDAGEPEVPSSKVEVAVEVEAEAEDVGFGQIWAFDDEISGCYDGLEFVARQQDDREAAVAAADEAVFFDGGLFDYPDVLCGPSDFADVSWRSESLPAI
ncbi:uncharacterized protein LOC103712879 [Phoenix dactylifera]|uniref:Uncharacterized protein LOC103712879 n=1 Tax=Phoenix dactylifera TaxID=42345 RepID=A0A8B7CF14_PHODC|nr:uncharacterized protein LOC103712879 [Phoenix dactylifera]